MDKKQIGVLAIVGASLMWAIEPIFAKLSYESSSVVQTSAFRAIFVTIVALLYALTTRAKILRSKTRAIRHILYCCCWYINRRFIILFCTDKNTSIKCSTNRAPPANFYHTNWLFYTEG